MNKLWKESVDIAYQLSVRNSSVHIATMFYKKTLIAIGRNNKEIENAKAVYFAELFRIEEWVKYPFIHAEIDCLSKIWKEHYVNRDYTIISLRIVSHKNSRKLMMAKPCKNCTKILTALQCKILYSNKIGELECYY